MNALAQSTKQNKITQTSSTSSLLVQRKCACGGASKLGGQCSECEKKKLVGGNGLLIQPKLKIGDANDKYEQEADRVADQVMRMPEPKEKTTSQGKTNTDRTKPDLLAGNSEISIQRQEGPGQEDDRGVQIKLRANNLPQRQQQTDFDEGEDFLQAKATPGYTSQVNPNIAANIQNLRGSGLPLPLNQRCFFESRMRQDFSGVRIHTDSKAADTAQTIQAKAFTLGNNIVFNAGQYQPHTSTGRHLLAHELSHTIQQRAASPMVQRAMKFELQTFNPIWRTKGRSNKGPEKLPRKFGRQNFLHKATRHSDVKRKAAHKEGKGMELQSETGGFAEFETPNWSSRLFGLKKGRFTGILQTIKEGVEMTDAMNGASTAASGRKKFPFDVSHLRKTSGSFNDDLRPGEELEVEIVDSEWHAAIQSSESIDLTQYESLLREHEFPSQVTKTIEGADKLVVEASVAEGIPLARLTRLRSFLQIIVNYITRGQTIDLKGHPSKAGFRLMSRTSFSSMFREILEPEEQEAFKNLVRNNNILDALGLDGSDRFFFNGHGSDRPLKGVTVRRFLVSIYASRLKNKKDYMSPPREDDLRRVVFDPVLKRNVRNLGSAAMGRFDVETATDKKDSGLIKIETRATVKMFKNPAIVRVEKKDVFPGNPGKFNVRVQPAKNWVKYAFELFTFATASRQRPRVKDNPATPEDETRKTDLRF